MGQEYFINSQELQDKVASLLPSQGGAGSGIDLSASTQIIPIIDLTESAEGSNLRQDLQSSISFGTATNFAVSNTTTSLIVNTGYWRVNGVSTMITINTGNVTNSILLNDGSSDKIVWSAVGSAASSQIISAIQFDLIFKLEAGHSLKVTTDAGGNHMTGSFRQIADIAGNLTNP